MDVALWIAGVKQEKYGQCLRRLAGLFTADGGPTAGGITLDPVRFALAAWQAATGPLGEPGYLGHHPRVLDATCQQPAGSPNLLAVVELASLPASLPSGWRTWVLPDYQMPASDLPAALGRLELRIPIEAGRLPTPTHPQAAGLPNLMDAQASVEAVLENVNRTVMPFLQVGAPA